MIPREVCGWYGQDRIEWPEADLQRRPNDPSLLAIYSAERNRLRQRAGGMVAAKVGERAASSPSTAIDLIVKAVMATLNDLGVRTDEPHLRETIARHIKANLSANQPDAADVLVDSACADWSIPEPVVL